MRNIWTLFKYSWRYALASVLLFLAAWHCYAVFVALQHLRDKITTSVNQNASRMEKAYRANDIVELRNLLGLLSTPDIARIRYIWLEPSQHALDALEVGGGPNNSLSFLDQEVEIRSNGSSLGQLQFQIDLNRVLVTTVKENSQIYLGIVVFMILMMVVANLGTLRTLSRVEESLLELERAGNHGRPAILKAASGFDDARNPVMLSFSRFLNRHSQEMMKMATVEKDLEVAQSISRLTLQVAHDIRSPLPLFPL